jgi:hypothetical protein
MGKKIPAGYPAGEGGMVEEIYIHYYRHWVQIKVTPFWNFFSRNCSGDDLRRVLAANERETRAISP